MSTFIAALLGVGIGIGITAIRVAFVLAATRAHYPTAKDFERLGDAARNLVRVAKGR